MNKKIFFTLVIIMFLIVLLCGVFVVSEYINSDCQITQNDDLNCSIVEISIEDVRGISRTEAEEMCYKVFGKKDKDTGFLFSFSTTSAVKTNNKQYYVIRASWLVDNNHLSYIGDFFVSSDGKEIYDGIASSDEYTMVNLIWSK